MSGVTYRGVKTPYITMVYRNDVPLELFPSLAIRFHSPTGFNWGYGGSGSAQLALALLLDVAGVELATEYYQAFKEEVVAGWGETWEITSREVEKWLTLRANGLE